MANFKFICSFILPSLLLSASTAYADQGGVQVIPFGEGGLRYAVNASSFELDIPLFVQPGPDAASVPFDSRFRPGCFLSSPWLPIEHARGYAQFLPVIRLSWTGVLFRRQGHAPILGMQVAIKKPDGTVRYQHQIIDSGHIPDIQAIVPVGDGGTLYQGALDNGVLNPRAVQAFEVDEGDQVRVSTCDLRGDASLLVKSLVLQSVPYL